ncbi:MAG: hypothetical protein HQK99_15570 [Nitrospirae bacterium]|nr:hypothetical protein [Nitrospirota bacterium]
MGNAYREFKGLANVLPPERMGFSYLSSALNVDIDDSGMIRRRPGYKKIYEGAPHSLWSDGRVCLFCEGGQLKELLRPEETGGHYSVRSLRQGLTSGRRMAYLSLNGTVYYSDGSITGAIDTRGESPMPRTWGMTPPPPAALSVISGSLRPGRYAIALTYVRRGGTYSPSGGQESGTSVLSFIETATGGITAAVTASDDPDVAGINLYVTALSGETLYLTMRFPNQSGSVSLQDEPAPMLTSVTEGLKPPPAGHLMTYYRGRIYTAAYDILYYSEPFALELYNMAANWIPFNGMITLLAAAEDGIFVGTKDEIFMLRGATPDKFTLHRVAGCGAVSATQATGEMRHSGTGGNSLKRTLFWESRRGKCSVSLEGGSEISYPAEGIFSYECGLTGAGIVERRDGMNLYISVMKGVAGNATDPPVNRYMESAYASGAPKLPLISISAS